MFRKGRGVFELRENEINQILMGDNSDDENNLLLDEEDQRFLTQDDDQSVLDVEIQESKSWKYHLNHLLQQQNPSPR